jgi:hypothetical protein
MYDNGVFYQALTDVGTNNVDWADSRENVSECVMRYRLILSCVLLSVISTSGCADFSRTYIRRNREAVLRDELFHIRIAIQNYMLEKEHGPRLLSDLVGDGYLKEIPTDVIPPVLTPSITSVSPSSGTAGTTLVAITGVNFGATQGSSTLTFNGVAASPTNWSTTGIVGTVPSGASSGSVIVTVAGASSNPVPFTVQGALGLLITSPADGAVVNQGKSVTVLVTSPAGSTINQLGLIGEGPIGLSSTASSVPAQFSISIPSGIACRPYMLTASGATASGQVLQSPPIFLDVERLDRPASLSAPLASLTLTAQGEESPVQLLGTFSDGSVLDVTESSYVSYRSSNTAVITANAAGMITAIGPGNAWVTATYGHAGQPVASASIRATVTPFLLTPSPASLSFGSQELGTIGTQRVTLTNTATSPVRILSVGTGGDFSEADNCVSSSPLAAGASCSVTVTFTPTIIGPENSVISIATSAQTAATAVLVGGTGTP